MDAEKRASAAKTSAKAAQATAAADLARHNDELSRTKEQLAKVVPGTYRSPRRFNSVSEGHVLFRVFEIEGLFTQGWRPGRTVSESVGGILEMSSSDWSERDSIPYLLHQTGH